LLITKAWDKTLLFYCVICMSAISYMNRKRVTSGLQWTCKIKMNMILYAGDGSYWLHQRMNYKFWHANQI
jgi:hypothetical protein